MLMLFVARGLIQLEKQQDPNNSSTFSVLMSMKDSVVARP